MLILDVLTTMLDLCTTFLARCYYGPSTRNWKVFKEVYILTIHYLKLNPWFLKVKADGSIQAIMAAQL